MFFSTTLYNECTEEEYLNELMTCGNTIDDDDCTVDLNTLENIELDFPLNVKSDFEVGMIF